MLEIYPNPYTKNPTFFGAAIRNSPLSTYSYFSSVDFEVSAYNNSTSEFSAAFVYRCGDPSAWAPFESPWSVYGVGVTGGAVDYQFSPWRNKTDVRFNYLNFGTDQETKVRVKYKKANVTSVDIGPYKKNYNTKWSNVAGDASCIEISGINPYDKLIVNINNDLSTPLYLFANPIETLPPDQTVDNSSTFLYLSAGIWEISALLSNFTGLTSDATEFNYRLNVPYSNYIVYLAPGCYVDGTFSVRGKHNVTFSGPGILDAARPYVGNWWTTVGFEADPPVNDVFKLRRSSIYSFSSFSEPPTYVTPSGIKILGPTIVNSIAYAATTNFKKVDNAKLISLWPNSDGFHIEDSYFQLPESSKYSDLTRSFVQTGDDTSYVGGNQGDGKTLFSSCYFITLAGTTFRSYFGQYNYNDVRNQYGYGFSAIDIDCRSYGVPGYMYISVPLNETFTNAIFGLLTTDRKRFWQYYTNFSSRAITNHLFSGITIENLLDIPIFDIGIKSYPETPGFDSVGWDSTESFGNISSIIFKDITVSSHPNSKYQWTRRNKIYADEPQYRVHDVSFINVRIDNQLVTNSNKDNYFYWYNKPIPSDNDPTVPAYAGSSIADVYLVIGDSIAVGADSKYIHKVNTTYSNLPSQLTGCYIWTTSSNSFEVMSISGQGNIPITSYGTASYGSGIAAFESLLAWKARQESGDRDVYIIKYAQGGTMALSSTSATYDSEANPASLPPDRLDWSVSSQNQMFSGFSSVVTSALLNLSSQYKHVDLKGGVIFLGTNAPIQTAQFLRQYPDRNVTGVNPYLDTARVSSLIDSDVSSLVSGLKYIIQDVRGPRVDLYYSNFVWVLPIFESWGSFDADELNNYTVNFNNKIKSLSALDQSSPGLSSLTLSLKVTPYYPPTGAPYLYDSVHYNFSGYTKITDDIYQIFKQQTSSVTNPTLNPEVNYYFYPFSENVKALIKKNGLWKQVTSWVKVNGEWKIAYPWANQEDNWIQGDIVPPQL